MVWDVYNCMTQWNSPPTKIPATKLVTSLQMMMREHLITDSLKRDSKHREAG